MPPLDFIAPPRLNRGKRHVPRAVAASLLLHGVAFGSVLVAALAFRSQFEMKNGSIAGTPLIALEKMSVIAPPKSISVAPSSPDPAPPAIVSAPIAPPIPREPIILPKPSAIPTLAAAISHPVFADHAETPTRIATTAPRHVAESAPAAAHAPAPASFAPGASELPHPPYPDEARDLGQTGTVLMNVLFDGQGNVSRADIAQTSGVALLDSSTRSYIRRHWHSTAYAGRTVSVPVEYNLQQM